MNILGYYDMLRNMIKMGIRNGFIPPHHEELFVFIDGPLELHLHKTYDWGSAVIDTLKNWRKPHLERLYDWNKRDRETVKKADPCMEGTPARLNSQFQIVKFMY